MTPSPYYFAQRDSIRGALASCRAAHPDHVTDLYGGVAGGLAIDMVATLGPEPAAAVFYAAADGIVAANPKPFTMPAPPPAPKLEELPVARYTVPADPASLVPALLFPLGLALGLVLGALS